MKKILFVIDTLRMGGAEKSLVSLLKAIDKEKYDIDLLLFESGGVLESDVPSQVHIIYADPVTRAMTLEFKRYSKDLLKRGKFSAFLSRLKISLNAKKEKADEFSWNIVKKHIPNLSGNYDTAISYLEGFPAFYVIDKVTSKKKIAWIHIDTTNDQLVPDEKAYYTRFDALITISDICKKAFCNHIPEIQNRMFVIENIVFPEEVLSKAELSADFSTWKNHAVNLVTIGRLDYQKGIDMAIEACDVLVKRGIDVCWHEYGTGVLKAELQNKINSLNLGDHFILEGMTVNPYPYMKKADMIVQTSRFEGKSIVLDEAKILGKAIITTCYESVYDQIQNKRTGMIARMTPESIADEIERVLNDSKLKAQLEKNALSGTLSYLDILDKVDMIL